MISRVPLPAYMPDQSNNSGVLLQASGVYKSIEGYRSVGDIEALSASLSGNFQGGASAIASDGQAYLLAGTPGGLFELSSVAGTWTSLLTGLSVSGRWKFAQFGDYSVAVTGGTTYEVDLLAGTAAVLTGAPNGTSVAVVGDYIVIGQADNNILKVRWSAFRDQTGWTNGTNQAGEQVMQTGGQVQAIVGGEYGVILQRERIVRMTRTGDALAPFQFDEISNNFGCASSNTVAQAGRTVFFRSDRGFMAIEDGQVLKPIGSEKVDRTFDRLVSRDQLGNIYTAVDPQNKLVMWLVPGNNATLWVYNFELDAWTTLSISARGLFPGFTTSISLDDFSSIGITNLDTATVSLDDARWSGGNPRLYLVSIDNKVGTLTGANLPAVLELGNSEFIPGLQARLRGIRPIWEGVSGITLEVTGRERLGDTGTTKTTSNYRNTGMMPVRVKGRRHSTTIRIAAGTDWDYIQALEFEYEQGGRR